MLRRGNPRREFPAAGRPRPPGQRGAPVPPGQRGAPVPPAAGRGLPAPAAQSPVCRRPPEGTNRYCTPARLPGGAGRTRSNATRSPQARFQPFLKSSPETAGKDRRLRAAVGLSPGDGEQCGERAPPRGEQHLESGQRVQGRESTKRLRTRGRDRGQHLGYELIHLLETWCENGFVVCVYIKKRETPKKLESQNN